MMGEDSSLLGQRSVLGRCYARIVLAAVVGLAGVSIAHAGGTVTSCSSYGPGAGSLANALLGGGTVTFACDGTVVVPEIAVVTDTTIDATGRTVALSGNGLNRVLSVSGGAHLQLVNVTVSGGKATTGGGISAESARITLTRSTLTGNYADYGGGLYAFDSAVSLTNSVVSGNSALSGGGMVLVAGSSPATLANSAVSGNAAAEVGGGLYVASPEIALASSTVSGNSAGWSGGGLYAYYATVKAVNSTVSGNSATDAGGGLYVDFAVATLANSTVTANAALDGAGIRAYATGVTLTSSIVARQASGVNCSAGGLAYGGGFASAGYNLDSDGSCGLVGAGDRPNSDPLLGPLQDNGGPTRTHALLAGSPAIDIVPSGVNGCGGALASDQRGLPRPAAAGCDAGSFEVQPTSSGGAGDTGVDYGRLGWGELAIAKELAAKTGVPLGQLIAEHLAGKGWGEIASKYGVKLGPRVSDPGASTRAAKPAK